MVYIQRLNGVVVKEFKILIVEDEVLVGLDLKATLVKMGHSVTKIAKNEKAAIRSVLEDEPMLILMDINLKNSKDGIDTACKIKEIKDIPILYLTAYCDEVTTKRAFETDPIAYLMKPFKRDDLRNTIELAVYKINQKNGTLYSKEKETRMYLSNNYYFDTVNLELYYEDIIIKLSKREKKLISILIEAKGKLVPLEVVESLIWIKAPVSDSALRTLMYRLRTKVEYKLIETVPYYGCKILLDKYS